MKYNMDAKIYYFVYHDVTKKELASRNVGKDKLKDVKTEYKAIIGRAKDIGKANLLASYLMGAYFIALCRKDGLSPDENFEVMRDGLKSSKMFKAFMGDADSYFDAKRTEKRKEWAKQSKLKKYENDWVLDVLDKTDDYELGYNYYECGVCKLFKDEGCFEWAKYLCMLDFPIAEIMGLHLDRTKTLAEGGDFCDFRYSKEK